MRRDAILRQGQSGLAATSCWTDTPPPFCGGAIRAAFQVTVDGSRTTAARTTTRICTATAAPTQRQLVGPSLHASDTMLFRRPGGPRRAASSLLPPCAGAVHAGCAAKSQDCRQYHQLGGRAYLILERLDVFLFIREPPDQGSSGQASGTTSKRWHVEDMYKVLKGGALAHDSCLNIAIKGKSFLICYCCQ